MSKPSGDNTVRYTRAELPPLSDEEVARLVAAMDDPVDTSDIPEQNLSEFVVSTELTLDRWVLDWFKQSGPEYQSRIRRILRAYVESRTRRGA